MHCMTKKWNDRYQGSAPMHTLSLAIANLLEKCGVVVSGGASSLSSMSFHSLPSVQSSIPMMVGAGARYSFMTTYNMMRGSTPFGLSSQPSSSASVQNMDIHKSHNATVEMVIADFFHCENISDAVVESPRFKRLVKVCRLVGDDFVVPNRKKVGGELLDINYEITYSLNKAELIREAKLFGFAWMGDGATIHIAFDKHPCIEWNYCSPMTVSIHDCTKHIWRREGRRMRHTLKNCLR